MTTRLNIPQHRSAAFRLQKLRKEFGIGIKRRQSAVGRFCGLKAVLRCILLCLLGLWTLDFGLWTCSAQRPSYDTFKLINDRNIFNQRRFGGSTRRNREPGRYTRVEAVTLAGTMSYDKGTFAFFEGTSSDNTKAVKVADKIAGYEVKQVDPAFVKLASSTNEIELRVGMQLRRDAEGEWRVTEAPEPSSRETADLARSRMSSDQLPPGVTLSNVAPDTIATDTEFPFSPDDLQNGGVTNTDSTASAPGPVETDPVLRRLAERRRQERQENNQ